MYFSQSIRIAEGKGPLMMVIAGSDSAAFLVFICGYY